MSWCCRSQQGLPHRLQSSGRRAHEMDEPPKQASGSASWRKPCQSETLPSACPSHSRALASCCMAVTAGPGRRHCTAPRARSTRSSLEAPSLRVLMNSCTADQVRLAGSLPAPGAGRQGPLWLLAEACLRMKHDAPGTWRLTAGVAVPGNLLAGRVQAAFQGRDIGNAPIPPTPLTTCRRPAPYTQGLC